MKVLLCVAIGMFFIIGCVQAVSVKKSASLKSAEPERKEKVISAAPISAAPESDSDGKGKIIFRKSDKGSHGDHWSAVFGFRDFKENLGNAMKIIANIRNTSVIEKNISDDFAKYRKDSGPLSFIEIRHKGKMSTSFPALYSTRTIPVNVSEIVEWEHVDGIEGQIVGAGKDTFLVNFFATDYLENKDTYNQGGTLGISLTGFIYDLVEIKDLPSGYAPDAVGYSPHKNSSCGYDYNFMADVLSSEQVEAEGEEGYILDLRLIRQADDENFFNLEAFVSKKNMKMEAVSVGQKVRGCFWLQGRLFFVTPQNKTFKYKEGDLLALQRGGDGVWQLIKILKIDRVDLKKGENVNILGQRIAVPIDDYMLAVSTSVSKAYKTLDELKSAVREKTWEVEIGHMPSRAGGIGENSLYLGSEPVLEEELDGYRHWKEAFDRGEVGIF